jgi:hypothetical protein
MPVLDLDITLEDALFLSPYVHCTPLMDGRKALGTKACPTSGQLEWHWNIYREVEVNSCRVRIGEVTKDFALTYSRLSRRDTLTILASLALVTGGRC